MKKLSREELINEARVRLEEIRDMPIYNFDNLIMFIFSLSEDIQEGLIPYLTRKEYLSLLARKMRKYFSKIQEAIDNIVLGKNYLESHKQIEKNASKGVKESDAILSIIKDIGVS